MQFEGLGKKINFNASENSNIFLFLSSKFISLFGTYIYEFALSLYVLKVTHSGTSFALNIVLGTLPNVILSPISGCVADRIDRKKFSIFLDVLSGFVVLLLILTSGFYGLKVYFIYATTFILSVINNFYDVSLSSSIPNLVNDKSLMKINSYIQTVDSSSNLMCPVIGGIVYGLIPIDIFLMINAVSFFVSAFLEFFIDFNFNKQIVDAKTEQIKSPVKVLLNDIRDGLEFMKKQKAIYALIMYCLILNLFTNAPISVVNPYLINNVIKMKNWQYGIIQGSLSIGVLVTSVIIGTIKENSKKKLKQIILSLIAMGAFVIITGITGLGSVKILNKDILFIIYVISLFITGITLVSFNVPLSVVMQRLTPDNMRGRVNGVRRTLASGLCPIGIIIAGILIDIIPACFVNIVSGAAIIIISIAMLTNKYIREL